MKKIFSAYSFSAGIILLGSMLALAAITRASNTQTDSESQDASVPIQTITSDPSAGQDASPANSDSSASASAGITPAQLSVASQIEGLISDDKKFCVTLNQKVEKFSYKMEGAVNKTLTTFQPDDKTYCANLVVNDFPDGIYKLTAEVIQNGQPIFNTTSIEISKTGSSNYSDSALENKCSQAGTDSSDECKEYYLDKYADKIQCRDLEREECRSAIKNSYIAAIVEAEKEYAKITAKSKDILGQSMSAGKLESAVNKTEGEEDLKFSVPLKEKNTMITVLKSAENVIVDLNRGLIKTAPIAVMVDSDGDGVPDEMEKRLGTNPDRANTDDDNYKDGEEIRSGYDPLGQGKKDLALSPVEKAIIQNQTLEQPRTTGNEDDDISVNNVQVLYGDDKTEKGYAFSGQADADSMVTLYIYSDAPLIATVPTDHSGNWKYELDNTLEGGEHEIYAAINDETGKILKKSTPLSFVAQKTKTKPVETSTAPTSNQIAKSPDPLQNYYLYGAAVLAFLGVIFLLIAILKRNKNKNIPLQIPKVPKI